MKHARPRWPAFRYVAFFCIAGLAGLVVWKRLDQSCGNAGVIAYDADDCVASGLFEGAVCERAFAATDRIARASGPVFDDIMACQQSNRLCLPHLTRPGAFVQKPRAWCVSNQAGQPALEPLYSNTGRS